MTADQAAVIIALLREIHNDLVGLAVLVFVLGVGLGIVIVCESRAEASHE